MKKYQIMEVLYKKSLLKKRYYNTRKIRLFFICYFSDDRFCTLYFSTISNFFTAHQNMVLYSA
ncbi:Hypothetical protein GbCGDNIH6_0180 [Granulibacter bethesdensis]|nr:Hypothetical protein GbCGDNIH6_0180 [Granulibacter bethesdensis]